MSLSVVRSSMGKFHTGRQGSSACDGRTGFFSVAQKVHVKQAQEAAFCKKCFGTDGHCKTNALHTFDGLNGKTML